MHVGRTYSDWICVDDSKSVSRSLDARVIFAGHQASVEDCVFHPTNPFTFASVGDDCRLIVWDSRAGPTPSSVLDNLHATDINCISWNVINHNLLLTGSSDHLTKIVDIRQLGTPNVCFHIVRSILSPIVISNLYRRQQSHSSMGIQKRSPPRNGNDAGIVYYVSATSDMVGADGRSPFDANVFLTSSEDSKSFVVDISRLNDAQELPFESGIVPGVIMSHVGHRSAAASEGCFHRSHSLCQITCGLPRLESVRPMDGGFNIRRECSAGRRRNAANMEALGPCHNASRRSCC